MWFWFTLAALANDLPDEGFESGSLNAWDATWGEQTALTGSEPIEGAASLGIALTASDDGFAQAGLYHDLTYEGGEALSASACVAPDPASPPSGDVSASLVIEIYDADGFVASSATDLELSNLSDVGELTASAVTVDGGFARFVLLVTSDTGSGRGGFLFDRVWMGEGEAPGCADLMPLVDDGDEGGSGETSDPDAVNNECGCAASGSPLGWVVLLPALGLLRRRRVSC